MYQTLKEESILLVGERNPNKINFLQMFDTKKIKDQTKEDDLRYLISEIGKYILEHKNPPGTARKFIDGWKLLYYEFKNTTGGRNKVFALCTKQQQIRGKVKRAMESVGLRGGMYSAKRYFEEFLEVLEDETDGGGKRLSLAEAMDQLDQVDIEEMDVNQIGTIISIIQQNLELDNETMEKCYFLAYEMLSYLESLDNITEDIDQGLDGAYTVAELYYDREIFHLALELYKRLLPLAKHNERNTLFIASQIRIAQIYYRFFPESEQNVIDTLQTITVKNLNNSNQSLRELYHALLGESYSNIQQYDKAEEHFLQAIKEAEVNISEPIWIAKAYAFLGRQARQNLMPVEASRYFLTAAALAFSAGDLQTSDQYRNFAAGEEVIIAHWEIVMSLVMRMENDVDSAIF